jgi:pilus assembly protein CpaF
MTEPIQSISWELVEHYLAPILPYFKDPAITSICVNRFDTIFIRRNGIFERTDATFETEQQLVVLVNQITNALAQSADDIRSPIINARLSDGSRVNAVLYPTSQNGTSLTVRLFPKVRYSLDDLERKASFSPEMSDFFRAAVAAESNGLVSGATGSGKSTLLNALANLIPPEDRTALIEDTAELLLSLPNAVCEEAPRRMVTGNDPVTMEGLLVNVLRQEAKRVIVGEVREPGPATALMLALNTGHVGVLSTIHANNAGAALRRLENMLLSNDSRIPYEAVRAEVRGNFHFIIHCERTPRHGQRVVEVAEIDDGELRLLYRWNYRNAVHERVSDSKRMREQFERMRISFDT